jgi:adenine/guanine phosphoribosyltransferase-like PRPP-binding protein
MEDLIISLITSIATGSTFGTIAKGILLAALAAAYFYLKLEIRKKQEELAQKEAEAEKQKQQAELPSETKMISEEGKEGEEKVSSFFNGGAEK